MTNTLLSALAPNADCKNLECRQITSTEEEEEEIEKISTAERRNKDDEAKKKLYFKKYLNR